MKKMFAFVFAATLCLGLTACNGDGSPEQAVRSAGYALQKGDMQGFKALLTGKALEKYGTQAGFAKLQAKFKGQKLTVLDTVGLKKWNADQATYTQWNVTIGTTKGEKTGTLDVTCKLAYEWKAVNYCREVENSEGHSHEECTWEKRWVKVQHCKIADAKN